MSGRMLKSSEREAALDPRNYYDCYNVDVSARIVVVRRYIARLASVFHLSD